MSNAEFVTEPEGGLEEEQNYPVMFGVTLTPQVSGIGLGLLGIGIAVYLLMTKVLPTYQDYQKLEADKADKEALVQQLGSGETAAKLAQLQNQIQETRALSRQVLALFSSERTVQTLLLDINRFVEPNQGQLISFKPIDNQPQVITDGSLGELVNNKLKRQKVQLEMEGDFLQTQSIVRDLERLQPLLLMGDFKAEISKGPVATVSPNGEIVSLLEPQLKTRFRMDVIVPLNRQEKATLEQQAQAQQNAN